MHAPERRHFSRVLAAVLSAPFVPDAIRLAANELALGEAQAREVTEPTLFLELNFRDQVDLMHVMVNRTRKLGPFRWVQYSRIPLGTPELK